MCKPASLNILIASFIFSIPSVVAGLNTVSPGLGSSGFSPPGAGVLDSTKPLPVGSRVKLALGAMVCVPSLLSIVTLSPVAASICPGAPSISAMLDSGVGLSCLSLAVVVNVNFLSRLNGLDIMVTAALLAASLPLN